MMKNKKSEFLKWAKSEGLELDKCDLDGIATAEQDAGERWGRFQDLLENPIRDSSAESTPLSNVDDHVGDVIDLIEALAEYQRAQFELVRAENRIIIKQIQYLTKTVEDDGS